MIPCGLVKSAGKNFMFDYIFSKIKKTIPQKWRDFLESDGFKRYSKNTGWMFLGRIFSLVLSFFVSVYMARNLGVEIFGTLNFVISFVSIAGSTFFVIDSILIKKIIQEPENTNKFLGSALVVKIVNALLAITTATVASIFFANSQITTILVFVFSTFTIFQSFDLIDFYFQAHADVKNVSIASFFTGALSALVKVIIISLHVDIFYLLLSYVFDHFMLTISYIYLYKKYVGKISAWRIDKNTIKNLIIQSWPFTLSTLAISIYMRVDQIFLKILLGSKAVGLYVVAVRFSEVWFIISSVICGSLLPAILNAQKTSENLFLTRSKRLYSLLFCLSVLICVFIFVSAPFIINFLYGVAYVESIGILRIYIWSIIGVFISTALQQILLAQGKFKTILSLNLIGMTLSLVLNYLFIPLWGIKGAAIANIFAYTLPVIIILSLNQNREQRKAFVSAVLKPLS